jgi:hypothetical protein
VAFDPGKDHIIAMRVTKNLLGEFVIQDEPMRLEGEEADQFLADMKARDEAGNDPARKQFLAQCAAEYRQTKR